MLSPEDRTFIQSLVDEANVRYHQEKEARDQAQKLAAENLALKLQVDALKQQKIDLMYDVANLTGGQQTLRAQLVARQDQVKELQAEVAELKDGLLTIQRRAKEISRTLQAGNVFGFSRDFYGRY